MVERTARRVIALTGGVASGKSSVAKILEANGADIIDADLLAREAIKPGSEGFRLVIAAFPTVFNVKQNEIDRKELGRIIFSSKKEREKLEDIVHPIVNKIYKERLVELKRQVKTTPIVYVVPLFFESRYKYPEIEKVIVVSADRETCIERIIKRNGLTREEAQNRVDSQKPITEKVKKADLVIENNKSLRDLEIQTLAKLREI